MRTVTLFTLLSTLVLLCIALAIFSGASPLSLHQVIGLFFSPDSLLPQDQIVFWQIRLPRIVAALLIGAALAGAGTTYQGYFITICYRMTFLACSGGGPRCLRRDLAGFAAAIDPVTGICWRTADVARVWLITQHR